MRLNYNGTLYRILFKHGQETNHIPGHGNKTQEFTIATIRTGEKDETDSNIFASAKVHRFYKDQPSLEAARKAAVRAALKSVNATVEFRTAVWKAYHTRPGGIKAGTVASASAV